VDSGWGFFRGFGSAIEPVRESKTIDRRGRAQEVAGAVIKNPAPGRYRRSGVNIHSVAQFFGSAREALSDNAHLSW
jgi:hypothetical protein